MSNVQLRNYFLDLKNRLMKARITQMYLSRFTITISFTVYIDQIWALWESEDFFSTLLYKDYLKEFLSLTFLE